MFQALQWERSRNNLWQARHNVSDRRVMVLPTGLLTGASRETSSNTDGSCLGVSHED